MASSKERILAYERTLQVTNNFSKFVDKSEVPCAAILSSAIDFASALLKRTYHLEDKYKLLMKEYYQKLKTPFESSKRRAQESCFVKIPFFDGKYDYKFGKDIMDFNMGLAEIESFCNKFYPPLSGQSPMDVNAVAYCIDSVTEDILEKLNKIFDGNIVIKCMELLAKEQGLLSACYLFFSHCLGLRVKILAIEMLYLAHMQDSVKVITVTRISTNGGPSLYHVSKGTGWVGSEKW